VIGACLKWLDERAEPGDDRFGGVSAADQAALEFALRHGELLGEAVTVATVGPVGAERALRDALACGAAHAVRVAVASPPESADAAEVLAGVLGEARFVWCGDISADRGSGSVPAFLAARLGARQALGAVAVELDASAVTVTRRLDGGRREVVRADAPCVVSVEGGVARLRRAGLTALLRAGSAPVSVVASPRHVQPDVPALVRPYRPRARALAAPHGDTLARLRQLTDAGGAAAHGERVTLDPPAAAERIVGALREWGYIG
jgi:electron transfer flavoprotein beta subunit